MKFKGLKVGIFTITDAINYGAFYQMFASYKYFEECGADVTIFYGKNSFHRSLVKYLTPNPSRQIRKLTILRAFNRDSKLLKIKQYCNEQLDVAILGSDEIWNLENNSFDHFEYYYGKGIIANKLIAYAPSIGYAKPETLYSSDSFIKGLRKIDSIFARDNATKEIAEYITKKKVEMVVDPTILFNGWSSLKLPPRKYNYEYILYYGYTSTPPFLDNLKKMAAQSKLPIISAGYNTHDWADENLAVSPFEFLALLRDAKYVFTTTFHGTVMSTLFRKKFCYYASGQKVKDFGIKFNIELRQIDNLSTTKDIKVALDSSLLDLDAVIDKNMTNSRELLNNAIFNS